MVDVVGSASGRPGLTDVDRRQLLYLDAVRRGEVDAARQLAGSDPAAALWSVDWASGTDLDPRLRLKLHVGSATAVAWGVPEQRPAIAACTREPAAPGSAPAYRLGVWDALSGESREVRCAEPAGCLSFATTAEGPVLVSGHKDGSLRIWDLASLSLRATVDIGADVIDLYPADSVQGPQVVTLAAHWRVERWSLPTGEKLGVLDAPAAYCIDGGRLVDGRQALLTGGDGLSLWALDDGARLDLPVPPEFGGARSVVLAASGGRDCAAIVDDRHCVTTFDLVTGAQTGAPITAHLNRRPDGLMRMWSDRRPHARLAGVSGTLAVPTPWRVHLWDVGDSQPRNPPLAGPSARSSVQAVWWQGREYLLTASAYDGVVALWDLAVPALGEPGHSQRVSRVALTGAAGAAVSASAEVAVSVDEGGTIVARHGAGGRRVADPLTTGIESTHALAAWHDGTDVIVATGAGSRYVTDGQLRRWNVTTGRQYGQPIPAHLVELRWLSRLLVRGTESLVTFGPEGMLRIWRPGDGELLWETQTGVTSKVTGFATGIIDGGAWAALSSYSQPMTLHVLDDLTATPVIVPEAGGDIVLDIAGPYILAAQPQDEPTRANIVRVWDRWGGRTGPDVRGTAEVTSAAVRSWPVAYLGRADGTVSLTDVAAGRDLCRPLLLPSRPTAMAVAAGGDLIVGFGSDVARVRPPVPGTPPSTG